MDQGRDARGHRMRRVAVLMRAQSACMFLVTVLKDLEAIWQRRFSCTHLAMLART